MLSASGGSRTVHDEAPVLLQSLATRRVLGLDRQGIADDQRRRRDPLRAQRFGCGAALPRDEDRLRVAREDQQEVDGGVRRRRCRCSTSASSWSSVGTSVCCARLRPCAASGPSHRPGSPGAPAAQSRWRPRRCASAQRAQRRDEDRVRRAEQGPERCRERAHERAVGGGGVVCARVPRTWTVTARVAKVRVRPALSRRLAAG